MQGWGLGLGRGGAAAGSSAAPTLLLGASVAQKHPASGFPHVRAKLTATQSHTHRVQQSEPWPQLRRLHRATQQDQLKAGLVGAEGAGPHNPLPFIQYQQK